METEEMREELIGWDRVSLIDSLMSLLFEMNDEEQREFLGFSQEDK